MPTSTLALVKNKTIQKQIQKARMTVIVSLHPIFCNNFKGWRMVHRKPWVSEKSWQDLEISFWWTNTVTHLLQEFAFSRLVHQN